MRIMLIRPKPPHRTIGLQHIMIVEPLELEVIAGSVPSGHTVKIIDMILESASISTHIKRFCPDVFCVTGYITHMQVMSDYCQIAKGINSRIVTITGGIHIEKNPQDCDHPWIDYRVVRNATSVFPKLIEYIGDPALSLPLGVLRIGESIGELPAFNFFYPRPRRDLVSRYQKRYYYVFHANVALIKTSFGCPSTCTFCYCRAITNGQYAQRPLNDVLDELESIPQKEIFIVDDNFLVSPLQIGAFINGIKERKINKHFLIFGRADFISRNHDIMRQLKDAGLRTVIVGLESFSNSELEGMQKNTNAGENEHALDVLASLKIDCYASIILSPDYTHKDFQKLRENVRKKNILFANFQPLTPLPGTEMQFDKNRLIVDRKDYSQWDLAHVTLKPLHMSVAQYYKEIIRLYTSSVVHPGTLVRHLTRSLPMVLNAAYGSWIVWLQYRKKVKEARRHGA